MIEKEKDVDKRIKDKIVAKNYFITSPDDKVIAEILGNIVKGHIVACECACKIVDCSCDCSTGPGVLIDPAIQTIEDNIKLFGTKRGDIKRIIALVVTENDSISIHEVDVPPSK